MPVMADLDASNVESLPCCGISSPDHEGRRAKNRWLAGCWKHGLRGKVLIAPDQRPCGYMEYVPGEYAWRGVDAAGYMFVHCLWIYRREHQHRGFAGQLLEACVKDARRSGMKGVATITREGPWMAGPALFQRHGFTLVDTAPPDLDLLVLKFDASAEPPKFKGDWEKKAARYGPGLTIISSGQCPYVTKFAGEIAEAAQREYGIAPRLVELKSPSQAQDAPTPYAVFSLVYNGRVVADHQISRTRFRNIMRKLV
jgi:L-amino acid N-acyltransferase YncA